VGSLNSGKGFYYHSGTCVWMYQVVHARQRSDINKRPGSMFMWHQLQIRDLQRWSQIWGEGEGIRIWHVFFSPSRCTNRFILLWILQISLLATGRGRIKQKKKFNVICEGIRLLLSGIKVERLKGPGNWSIFVVNLHEVGQSSERKKSL
jgi:hypothetical protein